MIWEPPNIAETCPAHTQLTACSSFAYVFLNLVVQLYGDSKDRRIQEKLQIQDHVVNGEVYDFIVVGAGASGCVVANRLSAVEKWKVLLLEAGPEEPDVTLVPALSVTLLNSNVDWQYKTMPSHDTCLAYQDQRCQWPR
ncbi:glucose dehydrogenase [FAD, quinone]-like [Choristoneura fumiferana]|uniref:glucose dehydrogenase [FAD, quinone]-like n=1 Tax=Choristoneura fumiferana TaxID=7141 RepID=UPI003D159A8F